MAATFAQFKQQLSHYLYTEKNKFTALLIQAESKTQVKREYLTLGLLGLLSVYLIFGYGAQLLCNLIGFVYPALCSIRALESAHKEDDTKWLTYWVVFALFSVSEFFSDILLSWFPFYWLGKCAFLAWCFMPITWNGSDVIYCRVVRPFFMKHQTDINSAVNKVTDKLGDLAENAASAAVSSGTKRE